MTFHGSGVKPPVIFLAGAIRMAKQPNRRIAKKAAARRATQHRRNRFRQDHHHDPRAEQGEEPDRASHPARRSTKTRQHGGALDLCTARPGALGWRSGHARRFRRPGGQRSRQTWRPARRHSAACIGRPHRDRAARPATRRTPKQPGSRKRPRKFPGSICSAQPPAASAASSPCSLRDVCATAIAVSSTRPEQVLFVESAPGRIDAEYEFVDEEKRIRAAVDATGTREEPHGAGQTRR